MSADLGPPQRAASQPPAPRLPEQLSITGVGMGVGHMSARPVVNHVNGLRNKQNDTMSLANLFLLNYLLID